MFFPLFIFLMIASWLNKPTKSEGEERERRRKENNPNNF